MRTVGYDADLNIHMPTEYHHWFGIRCFQLETHWMPWFAVWPKTGGETEIQQAWVVP